MFCDVSITLYALNPSNIRQKEGLYFSIEIAQPECQDLTHGSKMGGVGGLQCGAT